VSVVNRQATYTTTRLGVYSWLFEKFSKDGKPPGFLMKAALGKVIGCKMEKNKLSFSFVKIVLFCAGTGI
jgi:hypothetical protein